MSKMYLKSVAAAVAIVLAGFSTVNAEMLFNYDFSLCSLGILDGNDNWTTNSDYDTTVATPGPSPMSGNYLSWSSTTYTNISSIRPNNGDWSFSIAADVDFELSALVWVGSTYSQLGARAGIYDGTNVMLFGSRIGAGGTAYNIHWLIPGIGYKYKMDAVGPSIWEVGITGAATETSNVYDLDLWYEKTPGDANTRVVAHTLTNITLDMTKYNTLVADLNAKSSTYNYVAMDDIQIWTAEVPEPSAIALLVTGLIGLLAYAWRKRK